MRILLRVLAGLLGVAGGLALLVGGAAAVLTGSDDTVDLPERVISTPGPVITTSSDLLSAFGPTLILQAEAVGPQDGVWLGVAHRSDLNSYCEDRGREEISEVELSGTMITTSRQGSLEPLAEPGARDWWVAHAEGRSPRLEWTMLDGDYGVAVLRPDGKPGLSARIGVGVRLEGLFETALVVAGAGVLGLVAAVVLGRLTRTRAAR